MVQYVDDVLIDAPYVVSQEMISSLNIHLVVYGTTPGASAFPSPLPSSAALSEMPSSPGSLAGGKTDTDAAAGGSLGGAIDGADSAAQLGEDPYILPRKMGILKALPIITKNMTVLDMVKRIEDQRERFTAKYEKKIKQENEYYKNRYNL